MSISKRVRNTGAAGGNNMSRISQSEIQRDMDELLEKDNSKNRGERKRLGEKFYYKYWGNIECSCGKCGAVFRLPRENSKGEDITYKDSLNFTRDTLDSKCPCCSTPINKLDSNLIHERVEVEYKGLTLLKLVDTKAKEELISDDLITFEE